MITSFDAYRLYVGVNLHFTKEAYDVKQARGTGYKVTPEALLRRNDRGLFDKAARLFSDPKQWIGACVAGHVAGRPYLATVLEDDCAVYRQYQARHEKMSYQFQQDLMALADTAPAGQSWHKLLASRTLAGRLAPETAVHLDYLTGWLSAPIEISLAWPKRSLVLRKYRSFVPHRSDRYRVLAADILADRPDLASALEKQTV